MYMNGDIAYPLLDLVLVGVGVYVFVSRENVRSALRFPKRSGHGSIYYLPSSLHIMDFLY